MDEQEPGGAPGAKGDAVVALSFAPGQVVDGRTICGAKTRPGAPCNRSPLKGRTRCRLHGGASPVGPASAAWKTGRHSKYVRGDFLEAYERAAADPNILAMTDELALIDARVGELLLSRGDGGSPSALWAELAAHGDYLERSIAAGDQAGQRNAVAAILALRKEGRRMVQVWTELDRLWERRRRIAETERRRVEAAAASVSVGELTTVIMVLLADARDVLGDPALFSQLATVWRARLGPRIGPTIEG